MKYLILVMAWLLISTTAIHAKTESANSSDTLSIIGTADDIVRQIDDLDEQLSHKKKDKDRVVLLDSILVLYEKFVDILEQEQEFLLAENDTIIDELSAANCELQERLSIFELLTSPSDTIFTTPLPDEAIVPSALKRHYDLISSLQKILSEAKSLQDFITDKTDRYKALGENVNTEKIRTPMLKWRGLIEEKNGLDKSSLSKEQTDYITIHLYDPYMKIVNEYFRKE